MLNLKNLSQDAFIKNNLIFFAGSLVTAFLNYLYHPVLGRMMQVADFGEVQAFISLFVMFAVFAGLFKNVIVNIVSNYKGETADKQTILMLQKLGIYFSVLVSAVLLIFSGYFSRIFNFDSPYFFLALSVLLIIGVLSSTHTAIVQGLNNFKVLSISGIITSATKIVFAVILVFFGWKVSGAIGGLVLASLAGYLFAYFYSHKHFPLSNGFKVKIDKRVKGELWYAFLVFASSLAITFLYSADTLIVKRYFPADTAGYYSGIATIGRIIFFLTGSIAGVLLPSIKIDNRAGLNGKTLIKAFGLTFVIGGSTLMAFVLFPDLVTNLLIGARYQEFAHLLPLVGLFLFIVSLANLLFFYLLALRSNFVFIAAIVGPSLVFGLSLFRHSSLEAVILNFLLGSALVLAMLLGNVAWRYFGRKEERLLAVDYSLGG